MAASCEQVQSCADGLMSKLSSAAGELPTSKEEGLPQRKVLLSPKLGSMGLA